MRKESVLILSVLMFAMLASTGYSYWGPNAVLTESITGTYLVNGDGPTSGAFGTSTRTGYLDVYVPNTDDVLQYVRLNFSSNAADRTNIEQWNGSLTAYRDYAMSNPTLATATRMYLNTSVANQQLTYVPDFDYAPSFNLSMSVTNIRGGDDLYSENDILDDTNTLQFNFSIINYGAVKDFDDSTITYNIRFNTSSGPGGNDSVTIVTDPTVVGQGGAVRNDDDSDGSDDSVTWTGTLLDAAGSSDYAYILFNATVQGNENYQNTFNPLGRSDDATYAEYVDTTNVISEITVTGHFARGPVREGVDMMEATNWLVKTYITSIANSSVAAGEHNLTYNVSAWRVYNVTENDGAIAQQYTSNPAYYNNNANYILQAGTMYKVPSSTWIATETSKPYIAPYFDWHVIWNETDVYSYSGVVNFSMVLPTLYELDTLGTKSMGLGDVLTPQVIGDTRLVRYNVTAYHTGDSSSQVSVGKLRLVSIIPNADVGDNGFAQMNITNVNLTFHNGGSDIPLLVTDGTHLQYEVTNTTPEANGSVVITITDLSQVEKLLEVGAVGENMTEGDWVTLSYDIFTYENSLGSGVSGIDDEEYFHFNGNQTLWTASGTYIRYNSSDLVQASQNSINAYKQLVSSDPSNPELVDVTINLSVVNNVENIKLIDYIPTGMTNSSEVTMLSNKFLLTFNRTKVGTITTSDGVQMDAWEITNMTSNDGWDFDDDGYIAFTYQLELTTPGLYILPVQVAAFDPGVDNSVSFTRYGVIKYTVPEKVLPLVIDDSDRLTLLGTVTVGKPAIWRESFSVYNPNSGKTPSEFRTEVFKDSVEVYATYYDDYGKKYEESVDLDYVDGKTYAVWSSTIAPRESRVYELRVLTPPAVEVDRNVDVLEKLENKHVKIEAEIVVKNFADESYGNLRLNLNIPQANVFEIKDAFGNDLEYSGDSATTTVKLSSLEAQEVASLNIIYKQSYPTVIITPDRESYDSGDIANLEILIINGGDNIVNPSIETEIYTENMDLLYADLKRLETTMKPLETTEFSSKFLLPVEAPTGRYIANVRFGEDFNPITESSINFYVLGQSADGTSNVRIIVLIFLAAVLIYLAYKRIVRVKKNE